MDKSRGESLNGGVGGVGGARGDSAADRPFLFSDLVTVQIRLTREELLDIEALSCVRRRQGQTHPEAALSLVVRDWLHRERIAARKRRQRIAEQREAIESAVDLLRESFAPKRGRK